VPAVKRSQLFIRTHDETLSVAAMCINKEDCSSFVIYRGKAAQTPSRFFEFVSDDIPVLSPQLALCSLQFPSYSFLFVAHVV
jgi:hypothetical protein